MSNTESPTARAASFVGALIPVWLVTAAWDFCCASLLSVFVYGSTLARFWQGVASTAFGAGALEAGWIGVAEGLLLHLSVAFTWSAIFVAAMFASPKLRRAIRPAGGALLVAALYGPIIWLVMSLVVIPLATGRPPAFNFRWWVQVFAHLPFVTLPLVFTARQVVALPESRRP